MESYKVYMILNLINNKKYIGLTKQSLEHRIKNGLGYKKYNKPQSSRMYEAFCKYKLNDFNVVILEENLTKKQAAISECAYIQLYKTYDIEYGYNIEYGGFNSLMRASSKEKISKANSGTKNGMYNCGENHPMYGKHHSYESKLKMSDSRKGNIPWNKGKVNIYSVETLLKISKAHKGNKYNLGKKHAIKTKQEISAKISALWNDKNYRDHMSNVHKGQRSDSICKQVSCGGEIFPTIYECADFLDVHRKTLSAWLRGIRPIPNKFKHLNLKFIN